MKALINFLPINQSNVHASQLAERNVQFVELTKMVEEIPETKPVAYLEGEIFLKTYNLALQILPSFVPYIGFPGAEAAKIPEDFSLTLPDNEALRLVEKYTEVVGVKNEKNAKKLKDKFLKAFEEARNDGPVTRENIDIWLQDLLERKTPKIILDPNGTDNRLLNQDYHEGVFVFDENSIIFKISKKTYINKIVQLIIHETKHASDSERALASIKAGRSRSDRTQVYEYMDDKDAERSKELVLGCWGKVIKIKDAIWDCITENKGCDEWNVWFIATQYNRSGSFAYKKNNTPPNVKPGDQFKIKGVFDAVLMERKKYEDLILVKHPVLSYFNTISATEQNIKDQYQPETRVFETSAYTNQVLPEGIRKELCPKRYEFELQENQKFRELVEGQKKGRECH